MSFNESLRTFEKCLVHAFENYSVSPCFLNVTSSTSFSFVLYDSGPNNRHLLRKLENKVRML